MTENNEKQSIEDFIDALCANGEFSRKAVLDFLTFIEAPPHLRLLVDVCRSIQEVLPRIEQNILLDADPDAGLLAEIRSWQLIAHAIVTNYTNAPGKKSLRGYYRREHALYVALSNCTSHPALKDRYYQLLAQICYSAHILRRIKVKDKDYEHCRETAMRWVRQLAYSENNEALAGFPTSSRSLSDYCNYLDKDRNDFQLGIRIFLKYAVERKAAITRDRESRGRSPKTETQIITGDTFSLVDEDESFRSADEVTQLVELPDDDELLEQIDKALVSPLEYTKSRDALQFNTITDQLPTSRKDALRARKLAKRMALDNQMLSLRWRMLTVFEVACFLEAVEKLAKSSKYYSSSGVSADELAAILTCMFWTSSSLDSLSNFKLYCSPPDERLGNGFLATKRGQPPLWVINPPRPIGYEKPKKPTYKAETAADVLFLPVPEPARKILERYLDSRQVDPDKKDILFPKLDLYRDAVGDFLTRIKRPTRMRHKLVRISDYLFEKLYHWQGSDIVTSMLATGRTHFLGWVPLHYTSISDREIALRYRQVCHEIIRDTAAEIGLYAQEAELTGTDRVSQENQRTRIGTRYFPKVSTVRNLVAKLKKLLLTANSATATVEDILVLHNRMAIYTTVMIGYATGYRAVTDPYLRQASIDTATGFAVISDKDSDDCYHSRIIWVPPMVIKQLELYHQHLDAFGLRLMVLNRGLYFEVRERLVEARSRPMLFMLKGNLKTVTVSKGSLQGICVQHLDYELPANANRHYLLTRLLKRGCPRDVIAAYMGHWDQGTEAWGRFSSLSPQVYRENLERYLLPVLKKDGWLAIAGLGGDSD